MQKLVPALAAVLCLATGAQAIDRAPFLAKLGKYAMSTSPVSSSAKSLCICRKAGDYDGTAGRLYWFTKMIGSTQVVSVGCFVPRFFPSDGAFVGSEGCAEYDVLGK
jgi:hypothetical protein